MFAIVTDSTAYLTKKEAMDYGINIIPMTYTDTEKLFRESYSGENGSFERIINTGKWSTSQPSVDSFITSFKQLITVHDEILCIIMSSRLSGAYSSATIAANEVDPKKILVVDSLALAGGLKMLVKEARRLSKEGLTLYETAKRIEELRGGIVSVFSVDDMEPLRKSGRLGIVKQAIGTILNMRPILMLKDGAVANYKISKGKIDQINKMVAAIPDSVKEIDVGYFGAKETADNILVALKARFPSVLYTITDVGPVLGIHLGLTAIGVTYKTI